MKTLVMLLAAFGISATGLLFWTGNEFYWAGTVVGQAAQHVIGLTLVLVGIIGPASVGRRTASASVARD